MAVPYTITDTAIGVVVDFRPIPIPNSHPNFDAIRAIVLDPEATEDQLRPLVDIPKAIVDFTDGDVTVVDGALFYKGYEVKNTLANLILRFIKEGKATAAEPFKKFLAKAFLNPDPRAAADLYDWVVQSGLPITPEGNILAWKAVRQDYGSIHASGVGPDGQYDHHPGNVVKEDRHKCDPNPNKTCSRGLHFCSAPYLRHYASGGNRVIALEISPENVVAFPEKYDWEKGRACEYRVIGEIDAKKAAEFYPQGRLVYDGFVEAEITGQGTFEIESVTLHTFAVNELWYNRNGLITKIVSIDHDEKFPIKTEDGKTFTAEGRFADDGTLTPLDLVRKSETVDRGCGR